MNVIYCKYNINAILTFISKKTQTWTPKREQSDGGGLLKKN